jgi:hypothetical protein
VGDLIEVSVQYVRQTERAVLILDGVKEIWLPKSQVNKDEEPDYDNLIQGDEISLFIPEWLAMDKDLI